ncbi:MAG: virulence factor [Pseudomonadota bacterium]
MADVTVVYWRDIPAQVIIGKGRRGAKKQLSERFEQAIDRCAMKVGARDTDAYLAEWRKADPYTVDGDQELVAEAEADRLETEFTQEKLKTLIDNEGWDPARKES